MTWECSSNIIYPDTGTIKITTGKDFTYWMKTDTSFIANGMNLRNNISSIFLSKYEASFLPNLYEIVYKHMSFYGSVEVHIHDASNIKNRLAGLMSSKWIEYDQVISMDPSWKWHQSIQYLASSRLYDLFGTDSHGRIYDDKLLEQIRNKHFTLWDDDSFSGSTLSKSTDYLKLNYGIDITNYLIGIEVQRPQNTIPMYSAVKYEFPEGFNKKKIEWSFDMWDPRDFLIWASGLVVDIGDWVVGRAPYILPFVSPNIRMWIPKNKEKDFSLDIINLNLAFHQTFTGENSINLNECNPSFINYMIKVYNCSGSENMTDIVQMLKDELENETFIRKLWINYRIEK